jgi:hypothetical protein
MEQPGLDNRHRNKNGTIARKHGNTLISTLRDVYGAKFAPGIGGYRKLSDVLDRIDAPSLSRLVQDTKTD